MADIFESVVYGQKKEQPADPFPSAAPSVPVVSEPNDVFSQVVLGSKSDLGLPGRIKNPPPPSEPAPGLLSSLIDSGSSKFAAARAIPGKVASSVIGAGSDAYNKIKNTLGLDEYTKASPEDFNATTDQMGTFEKMPYQAIRGGLRFGESLGGGMVRLGQDFADNPIKGAYEAVKAPISMTMAAPGTILDASKALAQGNAGEWFANHGEELANLLPALGVAGGARMLLKGKGVPEIPKVESNAMKAPVPLPTTELAPPPGLAMLGIPKQLPADFKAAGPSPSPEQLPIREPVAGLANSGVTPSLPGTGLSMLPPERGTLPIPMPLPTGPSPSLPGTGLSMLDLPKTFDGFRGMNLANKSESTQLPVPADTLSPVERTTPGVAPSPGALSVPPKVSLPINPGNLDQNPFLSLNKPDGSFDLEALKSNRIFNSLKDSIGRQITLDDWVKDVRGTTVADEANMRGAKLADEKLLSTPEKSPMLPATEAEKKVMQSPIFRDYSEVRHFMNWDPKSKETPFYDKTDYSFTQEGQPFEGPIQALADLFSGWQTGDKKTAGGSSVKPSDVRLGTITKTNPTAARLQAVVMDKVKQTDPETAALALGMDVSDAPGVRAVYDRISETGKFGLQELWDAVKAEADKTQESLNSGSPVMPTGSTPTATLSVPRTSGNLRRGAFNPLDLPPLLWNMSKAAFEGGKKVAEKGAEALVGEPNTTYERKSLAGIRDLFDFSNSMKDQAGLKNTLFNTSKDIANREKQDVVGGINKALVDPGSMLGGALSLIEKKFPRIGREIRTFTQKTNPEGIIRGKSEIPGAVLSSLADLTSQAKYDPSVPGANPWKPQAGRSQRATEAFALPDGTIVQRGADVSGVPLDKLPPGKWEHYNTPINPQDVAKATAKFQTELGAWAAKVGQPRADAAISRFLKEFETAREKTSIVHGEQLELAAKGYEQKARQAMAAGNVTLAQNFLDAAKNARSPAARFTAYMSRVNQGEHLNALARDETFSMLNGGAPGPAKFNTGLNKGQADIEATVKAMGDYSSWAAKSKFVEQYIPEYKNSIVEGLVDIWKKKGKDSGLTDSNGQPIPLGPGGEAMARQAANLIVDSPAESISIQPKGMGVVDFHKAKIGRQEFQIPMRDYHEIEWTPKNPHPKPAQTLYETVNRIGASAPLFSEIVGMKNVAANTAAIVRSALGNLAEDPRAFIDSVRAGWSEIKKPALNAEGKNMVGFALEGNPKQGLRLSGALSKAYDLQQHAAHLIMAGDTAFRNVIKAMRIPLTERKIFSEMVASGMSETGAKRLTADTMAAVRRLTGNQVADTRVDGAIRPWVNKAIFDMDTVASSFLPDPKFAPPGIRAMSPFVRFWTFAMSNKMNAVKRIGDVFKGGGKTANALAVLTIPVIATALSTNKSREAAAGTAQGGAGPRTIDLGRTWTTFFGTQPPEAIKNLYVDPSAFFPEHEITQPIAAFARNMKTGASQNDKSPGLLDDQNKPGYVNWELGLPGQSFASELLGAGSNANTRTSALARAAQTFVPGGRMAQDAYTLGAGAAGTNPYQQRKGFLENFLGAYGGDRILSDMRRREQANLQAEWDAKKDKMDPEKIARLTELNQRQAEDQKANNKTQPQPAAQQLSSLLRALGFSPRVIESKFTL